MDALLTPVSSSYKTEPGAPPEGLLAPLTRSSSYNTGSSGVATEKLLTPLSTSYRGSQEESISAKVNAAENTPSRNHLKASSPSEALAILKNEPDHASLISTLHYLSEDRSGFNITSPGPLTSQLLHVLLSDIVPNYWSLLLGTKSAASIGPKSNKLSELELLLSCLRSAMGLNAVLLVLKQLIQQSKQSKKAVGGPNIHDLLTIFLQVLTEVLSGDGFVQQISDAIWNGAVPSLKQKVLWNEFLNTVGGGKIVGLAAEAEHVVNNFGTEVGKKWWIAEGSAYSTWLVSNITHWVKSIPTDPRDGVKRCGDLLSKAFRLGHIGSVTRTVIASLLLHSRGSSDRFEALLGGLPPSEQRNFVFSLLDVISQDYLPSKDTSDDEFSWWQTDSDAVSSSAGLLVAALGHDESRNELLVAWLTSLSGAGAGSGVSIRRTVIAALAVDKIYIEMVFDKSVRLFGDQLYIMHTPTMQQEVHAQVLLLSAGYIHRTAPLRLAMMMRSGIHLNMVSNRLAASSPRARFLGMVIGEALSGLVDQGDKKMDFNLDEMGTRDARWYKGLVTVSDSVGSLKALELGAMAKVTQKIRHATIPTPAKATAAPPGGTKIISIEELSDLEEEGDENDGLKSYAKPDTDEEDSDEDPTLITRNKPTSPVYIRDLITYLRDPENHDKQALALQTAAPMIRRKANFGTEVIAHAEELASLFVGLQDKYEIENFAHMRLHGMIAILIAQPLRMGQWYSKTFFDGDYSLSQRASILTTLGLGARELGGFGNEDMALSSNKLDPTPFPSKALPPALHSFYSPSTAIDAVSTLLSDTMIAPVAASLAENVTGPSILKVRTFSSRMAIEAKRKKPIANALAKIVADGFFFPLTGRFFVHLRAYGASSNKNVVFQPHLLSLFVKTLALLLHASGPSTLSLPQMTSEFWDLLLSLRTQSIGDVVVVQSMCFAFLILLEVNEDKRSLVERHGRQLLETREWVEGVFEKFESIGSKEDKSIRLIATSCLVKIREVIERYRTLLI